MDSREIEYVGSRDFSTAMVDGVRVIARGRGWRTYVIGSVAAQLLTSGEWDEPGVRDRQMADAAKRQPAAFLASWLVSANYGPLDVATANWQMHIEARPGKVIAAPFEVCVFLLASADEAWAPFRHPLATGHDDATGLDVGWLPDNDLLAS